VKSSSSGEDDIKNPNPDPTGEELKIED
jgi:hypothetical protein